MTIDQVTDRGKLSGESESVTIVEHLFRRARQTRGAPGQRTEETSLKEIVTRHDPFVQEI
jgi:polyhydroxyalkanoate synthesis regulator phasin